VSIDRLSNNSIIIMHDRDLPDSRLKSQDAHHTFIMQQSYIYMYIDLTIYNTIH